jgi:serine/threonine-protein kinase RsbW
MALDTGVKEVLDHYYPSTLDSVDLAEGEILTTAEEAGFEEEDRHRIGMAVRECMVNAVVHGNRYNRNKRVHVRVGIESAAIEEQKALSGNNSGTRLTIRIADEGEGFELQEVPDPLHDTNLLRHSGRGLFLMGAFMDDLKVGKAEQGGTEVTLVKISGPAE